jgi:hypothetical protein
MLTALEEGVKGGKWYSLMDKVYGLPNLLSAFKEVKRRGGGAGVDHQTIKMFERDLMANLKRLSAEMANDKADVDTKAREPGKEAAGNTDGARSSGASRTATCTGADL